MASVNGRLEEVLCPLMTGSDRSARVLWTESDQSVRMSEESRRRRPLEFLVVRTAFAAKLGVFVNIIALWLRAVGLQVPLATKGCEVLRVAVRVKQGGYTPLHRRRELRAVAVLPSTLGLVGSVIK